MSDASGMEPWRDLGLSGVPTRGEFRVFDTGVAGEAGAVLYAIDGHGKRHILIPTRDGPVSPDRRSAGIHLIHRTLEENGTRTEFVDISCEKPHLHSIFEHFAVDVLAEITKLPSEPVTAGRRVLARWRELLSREVSRLLSDEELAGLFGELWYLRQLVTRNVWALITWTGPSGSRHDFMRGKCSLEIKSTTSREARCAVIHGLEQLQAIDGGTLFLGFLRLEPSYGTGESVPGLISDLLEAGADAVELFTRLASMGYDSRDAEVYRETSFTVREDLIYAVADDFPRITPQSFVVGGLPNGVHSIQYAITLSKESPAPLDEIRRQAVYSQLSEDS